MQYALNDFLNYCRRFLLENEYLERDPAQVLRTPKKREVLPDVLDQRELRRLLATVEDDTVPALFVGVQGRRLPISILSQTFRHYAQAAGVTERKRVTPHTLRHVFASELLHAGANLRQIQELLGHKHLDSTRRYTRVTARAARRREATAVPHLEGAINSCRVSGRASGILCRRFTRVGDRRSGS